MMQTEPKYIGDTYLERPTDIFLAVHVLAHAHEHFFEESINLRHVTDWAMIMKANNSVCDEFWSEWKDVCENSHILSFGYTLSNIAKLVCGIEIPFACPSNKIAEKNCLKIYLRQSK